MPDDKNKETATRDEELQEVSIVVGDFAFDRQDKYNPFTIRALTDPILYQAAALKMMAKHYEFYGQLNMVSEIEGYVTRESVIRCDCGDKDILLDAYVDHGVISANGKSLLTCNDCKVNENIGNFKLCDPKIPYSRYLPHPSGKKEMNSKGKMCYRCMPVLGEKWKQKESNVLIEENGEVFAEALTTGAYLMCGYGGIIEIVDIPTKNLTDKKYVTLELMNSMGWKKIQCGFKNKETGDRSPIDDMKSIIESRHRSINQHDIDEINFLFDKYGIDTKKRICAFFAECSAETSNGIKLIERAEKFEGDATRENLKNWFDNNKKYGYQYRGGGVIQLTWKTNYENFAEWMENEFGIIDENIVELGTEYVSTKYPWKAGVFFWDNNDMGSAADCLKDYYKKSDINIITNIVNKNMSEKEKILRDDAYKSWLEKYNLVQ